MHISSHVLHVFRRHLVCFDVLTFQYSVKLSGISLVHFLVASITYQALSIRYKLQ